MKTLATFIMRGRMQAVMICTVFAVLSLLLPPLSYVSGAVVALVTLRNGARDGLLISIVSGLIMAALSYTTLGNPLLAVVFALVVWLPVLALATILRKTISISLALATAGLIAALAVVAVHMALESPVAWWQQVLGAILGDAINQQGIGDSGKVLASTAELMTGIMASAFLLSMMLSLFLGRWWQALLYNPGGFGGEFKTLRLDKTGAILGVVILLWLLVSPGLGSLPADLAAVVLTLYSVPGLALIHDWVSKSGANIAWLIGVYLLLTFAPQLLVVLAVIGFADTGLNLRRYIRVKD